MPDFITKFELGHPEREHQTREGWIKSAVIFKPEYLETVADTAKVTIND